MNAIILEETHRNKLLEMCKALFPEFTNIELEIHPQYDGSDGHIYFQDISMSSVGDYIHWFEFCSIYLMEKLSRTGGGKEFSDWISICFRWTFPQWDLIHLNVHPVDYLYNIFKELQ